MLVGNASLSVNRTNQELTLAGTFENNAVINAGSPYVDYSDSGAAVFAYATHPSYQNPLVEISLSSGQRPTKSQTMFELFYGRFNSWFGSIEENFRGILGVATPMADINDLKTISGTTAYNLSTVRAFETTKGQSTMVSSQGKIMNVNFSQGTWTLNGLHGFNTAGVVDGNTFMSNSITGTRNTLPGSTDFTGYTIDNGSYVKGTFIGSDASKVMGQTKINATNNGTTTTFRSIIEGEKIITR